jgi:hypothetical protein
MGRMVWSARELHYGHVALIEVGYDAPAGFRILGLVSLSLVVAEIWGEHSPRSVNCAIFEIGGMRMGIGLWEVVEYLCKFNRR